MKRRFAVEPRGDDASCSVLLNHETLFFGDRQPRARVGDPFVDDGVKMSERTFIQNCNLQCAH
jgi:hypothetical protein